MQRLAAFRLKYLTPKVIIAIVVIALVAWMVVRRQSMRPEEAVEAEDVTYVPTMVTHDANIIHTDSGIPRYHATAPVYYSFDNAPEPFWRFDKGAYIEQLDNDGAISATLQCDSAVYDQLQQIWNCMGNVRVRSTQGDKFLTNQMFYDVRYQKIYSDSFIHIEKSDRIIEGYGFESNSQITDYTLNNPTMILPVSDFNRPDAPADSSAATAPQPPADSQSTAQTASARTLKSPSAGSDKPLRPGKPNRAVNDKLSEVEVAPRPSHSNKPPKK